MAALVAACGSSGSKTATPASGTRSYKLHPEKGTVTLVFPARWRVTARTTNHVTFREGSTRCTYTVEAQANIVQVDAATAVEAARSLVPTGKGHILESGQRGSAAWRVVKLPSNGTQVRVDAVRTQPLRLLSKRAGRPTWLATSMQAKSDPGDECHSGTYRDTLGPYLGDALATLRARVGI